MNQKTKSFQAVALPDAEPQAGQAAMPVWLIIGLFVIFFWGSLYFDAHGGWFSPQVYAPYRNIEELTLFQPATEERWKTDGKRVFELICALCHGMDGLGRPAQAPPFVGSEWVLTDNPGRLARIPLGGLNGPIKVNGVEWNLAMPAMGATLPDEDLAAVLTYMRNSWGNKASEITTDQIKAIRAAAAPHTQPWTADELMKLP